MILKIYSENDYLADILHKNPSTDDGLYAKPLKDGVIIGNAVSKTRYDVLFWDKKKSYSNDLSNQLDYQSLCNPLIVLNVCTEVFVHLLKSKDQYNSQYVGWLDKTRGNIDQMRCKIVVPVFYIDSNWYRNGSFLLEKYFKGIQIDHTAGCNFILTVTGSNVFEAINLLNLVALFTHLTNVNRYDSFIDNSLIEKYVRVLTNIEQVPYFVFYLFIKRAVINQIQFNIAKPSFEAYLAKYELLTNFTNEDTQRSRIRFITEAIGTGLPVLDIGCGEFSYYKRLMNMGLTCTYYGVDREERLERLAEHIMNRLESHNLKFSADFSKVPTTERMNIIISEVIEHNSEVDAQDLIRSVLPFNFEKLIISTPNADFNQFYYGSAATLSEVEVDRFRHVDHQFEFTMAEFKSFIETVLAGQEDIKVDYAQVGDEINGLQPTQIAIFKRV